MAAPLVAGAAFGFGWSPCIGPILGSILGIAAIAATRVGRRRRCSPRTRSASACRSSSRASRSTASSGAIGWVKRHFPAIVVGSAVVLGVFGLLLMFDELSRLTGDLQRALTDAHLDWLVNLG